MVKLLIRNIPVGIIKAIIFDKDGTLSNSENHLIELAKTRIIFSENKFKKLKLNRFKRLLLKKLLTYIYGLKKNFLSANDTLAIASREQNIISTATIFSLFGFDWFKSLSTAQEIFDEVDTFLANKKDNRHKKRTLISGALDILVSLKKEGVGIALMTNDTQDGVEEFIRQNKLNGIFDSLYSAEDKPSKPNPEAIIELCKKMNYDPKECALISDADTDLKMAKEADIKVVIGFTGGWREPPNLNEKKFIIQNYDELKVQ